MNYPELAMQMIGKQVKILDGSGHSENTGYVKEIYNDGTCMIFNPQAYVQYFYADLRNCEVIQEVTP